MIIPRVTECIHGFPTDQCATCLGDGGAGRSRGDGSKTGQSFALVYAPGLRQDTFLHLNREGEHWKIRWYPSPTSPPVELAGSAQSSSTYVADLRSVELRHEIWYPTSMASDGVTVKDSRYWFDAIARANAQHADRVPALRPQG